jgi:hypothetical protein
MLKNLNRHPQISEYHCGPAVVQLLLENLGISKSQEEITDAAGATKTIYKEGTRVDQLALAVHMIAPHFSFYFKDHATLEDIKALLHTYDLPVAVEWQGMFGEELEDDDDTDYGHYSVVTTIDIDKNEMIIVDPYKDFVSADRIIKIDEFLHRWWDINEYIEVTTGLKKGIKDEQLLFIIAPKDVPITSDLHLKLFY